MCASEWLRRNEGSIIIKGYRDISACSEEWIDVEEKLDWFRLFSKWPFLSPRDCPVRTKKGTQHSPI
jgi:hypothetical protein